MSDSPKDILSQCALFTDEVNYRVIKMPANAILVSAGVIAESREAFSSLIIDKDEVSVILSDDNFNDFKDRLVSEDISEPYRLITFDCVLAFGVVGFMAHVAAILAEAGVSILAVSAYSRDHILVPADKFDTAWQALSQYTNSSEV